MKTDAVRNSGLALIGLAALTAYILACTSFSPDDKKILYPTLDPQSGAPAVAIYDRESSRSHVVFVPAAYGETNMSGALVRAQWLGNGRRVLVAWSGDDNEGLSLGIVPVAGEAAVRFFHLVACKDAGEGLIFPVAVAGHSAFLNGSDAIIKLNLATGEMARHDLLTHQSSLYLYAGLDEESLFYLAEEQDGRHVFGRLNPRNFELTPTSTFTNHMAEGTFFAYDERGRRVAFVEDTREGLDLVLLEAGKPQIRKALPGKEALKFGSGIFMSRKDLLLASYMREGTNTSSFGLLEIPLKEGTPRDTVLIRDVHVKEDMAPMFFQAGVSHDGKTAAVSSAYLACFVEDFKPQDCALFLVDLNSPQRKVTRVPIALPANKPNVRIGK